MPSPAPAAKARAAAEGEHAGHGSHRRHRPVRHRLRGAQPDRIRPRRLTAPDPTRRGWALVTGAARRIGRVLALTAAEAGYDVVVHARTAEDARQTSDDVRGAGRRAEVAVGDLAASDIAEILVAGRPEPLTLLVNCASLFEDDRLETTSADALERAFGVNVRAPILLSQAFAAQAPAGSDSLIVNILDQRVLRLDPRYFSYSVSRTALWGATTMMAQALGPRVRVNAIGPGPTLASIHQSGAAFEAEVAGTLLRRPVTPEDIAGALRYLIGARAVTGQLIAVDGGQHLGWETPDVVAAQAAERPSSP